MTLPMEQSQHDQMRDGEAVAGNDVASPVSTSSNGMRDSPCPADGSPPPLAPDPNDSEEKEVRKSNVSDLVAKSKKAAASLWTLLHAKNCRIGVNRCSHSGCAEAKLMYLHLKTCSAGVVEPCPTGHKGCQDARKLLAHYRRCRDIRARQSNLPTPARAQHHVCLVCSLVARHAKFTLDRSSSTSRSVTSIKSATSTHFIPSLNLNQDACRGGREESHTSSSTSMPFDGGRGILSSRSPFSIDPSQPRFAFSRSAATGGLGGDNSGFQALQAAVSCALSAGPHHSPEDVLEPIDEIPSRTVQHGYGIHKVHNQRHHRPRSESLDVCGTPSAVPATARQPQQGQPRQQEKNMSYLYLAAVDSFAEEVNPSQVRRRSLSCTVPSSSSTPPVGQHETMLQNPIGEELQYILGADSL